MEKKKPIGLKDVFKNVEYIQIKKNHRQVLLLEDKDVNGTTKTALAKLIGEKAGEGVFHYVVKYFDNPKLTVGKISSIISKSNKGNEFIQPDFSNITDQMKRLEDKFERGSDNQNFTMIMQMKDDAYKIQIEYWKNRVTALEAENEKLKKEIESDGGGNNQLIEVLLPLLTQALTK